MTNILTKIIKANQEYEILGGGPSSTGEGHEVITQAAYDQLTPAQKAEKVYMITEDGVPGSGLTAGAGIDITNNVISADMSTAVYDNTTSGATATNMQDAMDEVFQSVSNGKGLIADAITDKGVSTSATDSFQTMAENISSLPSAQQYSSALLMTPKTIISDGMYRNIVLSANGYLDIFASDNSAYYKFALIDTSASNTESYHILCWKKTPGLDPIIQQSNEIYNDSITVWGQRAKNIGNNIIYSILYEYRIGNSNFTDYYKCMTYNSSTGFGEVTAVGQISDYDQHSRQEMFDAWTTICGITAEESVPAVNAVTLGVFTPISERNYIKATIN